MKTNAAIAPTLFQQAVLRFRKHCMIVNAGGRGSGKTFSLLLHVLDHCRDLGPDARPLVLREQWSALQEIQLELLEMCVAAFGKGVTRNKAEGTLTLPNGATITFSNVSDENSYARHQGRSYTGLFADEVGNYPPQAFKFLTRVRSNLRVPPGQRIEIHYTANPHGRSHTTVYRNYITKAPPWHPFEDPETGDYIVWTTSDLTQNPHIDREGYRRQLLASTSGDKALAAAWIKGDWGVLGGVMFDCFDPSVHIIARPPYGEFRYLVGADWGTASPSAALLLGRLKGPIGPWRPGDIFVLDETDTAFPDDLSSGTGASVPTWAEMLKEMMARNGRKPTVPVVTDDARGLQGDTVVNELRACQIGARRPYKKDRVGHWALIRSLLQSAVEKDGRPGLWIADRCGHLLQTLPEAPRGTLRAEDIDPKFDEDHWLDALAYGATEIHQRNSGSGRRWGDTY